MAIKTVKGGLSNVPRVLNGTLRRRPKPIHALIFCLAILPACLQGVVVLKYGVNIPHSDDWIRVRLFQAISQGTLSFGDLIAQANDTRPFFPNLVSIALAYLTNWDVRYEMLASFLLACLVSFNVYYLGKRTIGGSPLKRLSLFFLANLFIFDPIQAENWLRSAQLAVFMAIACITACLSVAYSGLGARNKFLICMVLSTISTFSFANGILSWILVLPVLAWSRSWSDLFRKKWLISGWIAGFALNAALYFHDYQTPAASPDRTAALAQPAQALQYFLSFLGAPYSRILPALVRSAPDASTIATVLGAGLLLLFISLCVYLLWSWRNFVLTRRSIGWLMLGAYPIISALVVTSGRLGFGVDQSLTARYTTHSLYLAVPLIYLMTIVFGEVSREGNLSRGKLVATVLGPSLIAIVVFLNVLTFIYWPTARIPSMSLDRSNEKACLMMINVVQSGECLTGGVYSSDVIDGMQGLATTVNDMGFLKPGLVESDKVRDIEGAGSGSATYGRFDSLTRTDEGSYLASGWAISPEKGRPADAVLLAYEDASGEPTVFAVTGPKRTTRKDVAGALGSGSYLQSGWQEAFSSNELPAGATKISAWAFDAGTGKAFELDGTHALEQPG